MRLGSLKSWAVLGLVGHAYLGTTACTGGAGSLGGGISEWEPASSSTDKANSSGNSAPTVSLNTPSNASSSGTTTTSDCSGTYSCQSVSGGTTQSGTVVLTSSGGGSCSIKGTSYTVGSDDRITQNGQSVGTWAAVGSSSAEAIFNTGGTYSCSKTSTSTSGNTTITFGNVTVVGGAPAVDAGR
jgi:hypothetical protein